MVVEDRHNHLQPPFDDFKDHRDRHELNLSTRPKFYLGFVQTWGHPKNPWKNPCKKTTTFWLFFTRGKGSVKIPAGFAARVYHGCNGDGIYNMKYNSPTWYIWVSPTMGPNCHFTGVEWWIGVNHISHRRSNNERSRVNVHGRFWGSGGEHVCVFMLAKQIGRYQGQSNYTSLWQTVDRSNFEWSAGLGSVCGVHPKTGALSVDASAKAMLIWGFLGGNH